jgi:hypothetical protein
MAADLSTGMEKAEMKVILKLAARDNPMSFAFASDKKQPAVALLVMHKTKSPKACQQLLLDSFPDAFNLRFGTLAIDADNPKKVNFTVNKAISSFAKRLTKTLKGTGFSIADILLEDGTSVESASDDEDAAKVAALGTAEPQGDPALAGNVPPVPGAPPMPPVGGPPPGTQTPAPDVAALKKELSDLAAQIKAVAGSDTALLARLLKFATDANVNIKTNNLTYAAAAIGQLRTAMAAAQPAPAAPKAPPVPKPPETPEEPAPTVAAPTTAKSDPTPQTEEPETDNAQSDTKTSDYDKSARIWRETVNMMQAEMEKLQAAITSTLSPDPRMEDILADVPDLSDRLEVFDLELAQTLDALDDAEPAEREKLRREAAGHIKRYEAALETPFFKEVDDKNGFAKVAVAAAARRSLTALGKILA